MELLNRAEGPLNFIIMHLIVSSPNRSLLYDTFVSPIHAILAEIVADRMAQLSIDMHTLANCPTGKLSKHTIVNVLDGISNPTAVTLVHLADALGLDITINVREESPPPGSLPPAPP